MATASGKRGGGIAHAAARFKRWQARPQRLKVPKREPMPVPLMVVPVSVRAKVQTYTFPRMMYFGFLDTLIPPPPGAPNTYRHLLGRRYR